MCPGRLVTTRRAAWLGLVTFAVTIVAEHCLRPALSPLTHQISEYATGGGGALAAAGFAAWSLSLGATSRLVWCMRRNALAILFALAAVGMATVACFETQTVAGVVPRGAHITLTGHLHNIGSGVSTLALLSAALLSAWTWGPGRFRLMTAVSAVTAVAINLALLQLGPEVGGLRQRLLVLIACGWQAAFLVAISRANASHRGRGDHLRR